MINFDHKLSSLIVQSLGQLSIGYSEKVHIQKFNLMRNFFSGFKDNVQYKQLQENSISSPQSINVDLNWSLTQTNKRKYKCIVSELTISFLIDNLNDNFFPDWECWYGLNDDISFMNMGVNLTN